MLQLPGRGTPRLRQLLGEALQLAKKHDNDYVFTSRPDAPDTDSGFKANWSKIMAAYVLAGGERFTAYDLRAMYMTEAIERGWSPETHKKPATTRRVYDRRRKVKGSPWREISEAAQTIRKS